MKDLPPKSAYKEQIYAGTMPTYHGIKIVNGSSKQQMHVPQDCCKKYSPSCQTCYWDEFQLHEKNISKGFALLEEDLKKTSPWRHAFKLAYSLNFTNLLYRKFAQEKVGGIPEWKMRKLEKTFHSERTLPLRNSVALRIEPEQYHLSPHIDIKTKIVTWQFFHPENRELEDKRMGTRFYRPRPEFHFDLDDKRNPEWLDYAYFDFVKELRVVPNFFFSFAPNTRSFHGAQIDPQSWEGINAKDMRRTWLGFLTSGFDHFHHFRATDTGANAPDYI
jgi:hypothetical protein